MPWYVRFLLGGLGALIPVLLTVISLDVAVIADYIDAENTMSTGTIVGFLIKYLALFCVGGFVASWHVDEHVPFKLIELGVGAPAVLSTIIMANGISGAENPNGTIGDSAEYPTSFSLMSSAYADGSSQIERGKLLLAGGFWKDFAESASGSIYNSRNRFKRSKIAFVFVSRQQLDQRQLSYKLPDTNVDIEHTIKSIFVGKGYKVISGARMESRAGGIYRKHKLAKQYINKTHVNWLSAERAAEKLNSDFFVFGNFDIGIKQHDNTSGKVRINVRTNAELVHLGEAETLAVVGNTTYSALGNTEEEAINNALTLAAGKVAHHMASQLNIQGYK